MSWQYLSNVAQSGYTDSQINRFYIAWHLKVFSSKNINLYFLKLYKMKAPLPDFNMPYMLTELIKIISKIGANNFKLDLKISSFLNAKFKMSIMNCS